MAKIYYWGNSEFMNEVLLKGKQVPSLIKLAVNFLTISYLSKLTAIPFSEFQMITITEPVDSIIYLRIELARDEIAAEQIAREELLQRPETLAFIVRNFLISSLSQELGEDILDSKVSITVEILYIE